MNPQRILFTQTPAFNPNDGGVQRITWKLGKYFIEQGHEVSYYSLDNEGHIQAEYGTLYHCEKTGKNNNPDNMQHLEQTLKQVEPDIVINQMPYEKELRESLYECKSEIGYMLLGCLNNSLYSFKSNAREKMREMMPHALFKMVDNPLGIGLVKHRHKLKHGKDLKLIMDQHDYFILPSPPNRDELKYFVGDYKNEKVASIPNSIPAVDYKRGNKEKTILHVGRINISQKRSDLLVDFWQHLHEKVPDWNFVIVGDGPYFDTLKDEISKKNLPRVSLEGFQKPEAYYQKASVFMMPSAYEGFPSTLLEAQIYGCAPVLFDSYKAVQWIVNDGKDAHLIKPFDSEEMAIRTAELCKSRDKLSKMQQAALKNADRFTIAKVGSQWEEFFMEKIQQKKESIDQIKV